MSDELDRIIAAERTTPPEPPAGAERVGWQRLQRDLAIAVVPRFDVPPPVVESVAIAKTGATFGIVGKAIATVVVAGATTTAVVATRSSTDAPKDFAPIAAHTDVRAVAGEPAPTDREVLPPLAVEPAIVSDPVEVPVAPVPSPTIKTRKAKPTAAPVTASSLEREQRLLGGAQRSLANQQPGIALELVEQHAREFPHGAMSEDRDALRVRALCRLGRTDEAERRRAQFFRRWPGSLHAARVRAACGE